MSERTPGDVLRTLSYIVDPTPILTISEVLEDFIDEVRHYCFDVRDDFKFPENPTEADIRQYAVWLILSYQGWLIDDWEPNDTGVHDTIKEHLIK